VQILPESQLIPYLREAPRGNGWWKQQALKLEAHSIVETDFYLVLDADCLVVRPVEYGDLVRDGRGLVHLEGEEGSLSTEQWYRHSSKVLSLSNPGRLVGLTPFLFSREISSKLVEHFAQTPWRGQARRDEGLLAKPAFRVVPLELLDRIHALPYLRRGHRPVGGPPHSGARLP
jgi:hypothetical protein